MAGKKNRRTLAADDREKKIVVSVTDMRFVNKSSPPQVPRAQVVIFLLDADGTRIAPTYKLSSPTGPAVFGHFRRMAPGTYTAHAYRDDPAGPVRLICQSKSVTLSNQTKAGADLELELAPSLVLEEASFVDDHAVLVPSPKMKRFIRDKSYHLDSDWGDGPKPKTKPFKPEWKSSRTKQHVGSSQGDWHPASYSRTSKKKSFVKLKLRIRVEAKAGMRTLGRLLLKPKGVAQSAVGPLTFEDATQRSLVDGSLIDVTLRAREELPGEVGMLRPQFELIGEVFGVPINVTRRLFNAKVFVTWATPRGKVEAHQTKKTSTPFPEGGDVQSVTVRRLEWAVKAAAGARSEQGVLFNAQRQLFLPIDDNYNSPSVVADFVVVAGCR